MAGFQSLEPARGPLVQLGVDSSHSYLVLYVFVLYGLETIDPMTDDEFVTAFETCTLPREAFHHREHVRLAWAYLRRLTYADAARSMEGSIRRFAGHHGASGKYHHTLTLVWMRLVAASLAEDGGGDFAAFLARYPDLLDQSAPMRFYSAALLASDAARAGWVEPDVRPLPEAAEDARVRNVHSAS